VDGSPLVRLDDVDEDIGPLVRLDDVDEDIGPLVRLDDVDEDIGHTVMHYLYTGDYQTVKPPSTCELSRRAMEYTRSVLAYRAAVSHGLDGLAEHAMRYMQIFDNDVSIIDTISLGRKIFPGISEDPWFSEYLTDRITASFQADKGIFQREQFFEGFGESLDFDKFLGKVMAQVYSSKISAIRYEAGLRGGDNTTFKLFNDFFLYVFFNFGFIIFSIFYT
jgi:hypothetical protein